MNKYTLFEREVLKSVDKLNFHHGKLSAKIDELSNRVTILESLVNSPPSNNCYDSCQVCQIASISYRTLQRWRKDGKIVYKILHGKYYYPIDDFCELMTKFDKK